MICSKLQYYNRVNKDHISIKHNSLNLLSHESGEYHSSHRNTYTWSDQKQDRVIYF